MVVPYGDPGATQRRKNAFDVGEYGMGMCANSLELGCDCLGLIRYFDAHSATAGASRSPSRTPSACTRRTTASSGSTPIAGCPTVPEVRRSRRLVVSSISTVENYEYGFFWYLYQDGTIQFEVKLTGILSLGAYPPGEKPAHGVLVAPQLYAPNHQHFFNMRLDFDLDGIANTVSRIDVVADRINDSNPFENAFQAIATPLVTEKQARGQSSPRDDADLEDRQSQRAQLRRRTGRLQAAARRQLVPVRLRRPPGGAGGPGSSIITSG